MNPTTFDWLWTQIEDSIQSIMNRLNREGEVVSLVYGLRGKRVVQKEYVRIRDALKSRCYAEPAGGGRPNRIDHHKIAACLCAALLSKKLLRFRMDAHASEELLRSNYELAYTVSLRVVYLYMLYSYQKHGKVELADQLRTNGCLYTPETTPSHDNYDLGRIKTLALNDHYGIPFDLLAYADMMFWIEHYNRQLLENAIRVQFPLADDGTASVSGQK